jgi:hypothetical protein
MKDIFLTGLWNGVFARVNQPTYEVKQLNLGPRGCESCVLGQGRGKVLIHEVRSSVIGRSARAA